MKFVSYNIQYGMGLDGQYDIQRIADAVRDADVIALQEVTRNNPRNGGRDMVAELRAALPQHFGVFGSNFEADMGSHIRDGRAIDMHFQFGNMLLSRTPILSSRNLLLPRRRTHGVLNFQRGALEGLLETELGPLRVYSVHLDHRNAEERLGQIAFLRERLMGYEAEGGAVSGMDELGFREPPHPAAFVAMGDFNMVPSSPEHAAMTGAGATALVDAAAGQDGPEATTYLEPANPDPRERQKRIDYIFAHAALAGRLSNCRVDRAASGSDHLPLWVEID